MADQNELVDPIICPHCLSPVLIEKLNCRIFRHGVFKDSLKQMDPHLPRDQCQQLLDAGLIYGCGKPFEVKGDVAVVCDYI